MPITPAGSATELCNAGSGGGGGSGTVTSITDRWTAIPEILVNGLDADTITTSGTFAHTWVDQGPYTVLASPGDGSVGTPLFRGLVINDIPDLGSLYWKLTGNTGTVIGTNYIGTNDDQGWMVKTNSVESFRAFSAVAGRAGHVTFCNAADRAQVTIDRDLDWTDSATYKDLHLALNVSNTAGADSGLGTDGPRVLQSNMTHAAGPSIVTTRYTWNTAMSSNFIYTGAPAACENAGLSIYATFGGGTTPSVHAPYSRATQAGDGSQRWLGHEVVVSKPRYQLNDSSLMVDSQIIAHAAYLSSEVAITTSSVNMSFLACNFSAVRQGHGFLAIGTTGANWTYPFHYRDAQDFTVGTTAIQTSDKFRVDWTGLAFQRFAVISPDAASSGTGYGDALTITEDAAMGTANIVTVSTSTRTTRNGILLSHGTSNWTTGAALRIDVATAAGAASGTFTPNIIECHKDGTAGSNLKFWVEAQGNVRGRFMDIGPRVDGYVASPANIVSVSDANYAGGTGDMYATTMIRGGAHVGMAIRQDVGAYTGVFIGVQSNTAAPGGVPAQGSGSFAGHYLSFTDFTAAAVAQRFYVDYQGRTFYGDVAAPPAAPTAGAIVYSEAGSLKCIGSSGTITVLAPA